MCDTGLLKGKIKKKNRGSATVEMCFIMPIIVYILVGFIYLFLYSVQDGKIQEKCYTALYTYTGQQGEMVIEEKGKIYCNTDSIDNQNSEDDNVYRNVQYSTEYGQRTARLRRWQLYGDVLQEQGD